MKIQFTFYAALCASGLLSPLPALAHAHLDHTSPAAGSTSSQAPKEVAIWFTEALEPKFSSIVVQDAKGTSVHEGSANIDKNNSAKLSIALKPLPPGTYKVIWRVLSVDTHRTQGSFTFRVGH